MFSEYFTFKDFFLYNFIPQPVFDKYNLIVVATCRKCPIFTIWSYKSDMSTQIKSRIKKKRKSVWWIFCESWLGIIMTLHANMLSHQFGGITHWHLFFLKVKPLQLLLWRQCSVSQWATLSELGFTRVLNFRRQFLFFLGIDFVTFACLVCCLLLFISGNQCFFVCFVLFLFCLCQLMNCGMYSIRFQLKLLNLKHSRVTLVCWPSAAMPLVSANT